jgi:hypothetical protein
MRGQLLVSLTEDDGIGGDYLDIYTNSILRKRIYTNTDKLYSCPIYVGDVITITTTTAIPELSGFEIYRRDYTTENIDGNNGIFDTLISCEGGINTTTFTATTINTAYDFDYKVTIKNSKVIQKGLALYLDASNPLSYSGTGETWYDLTCNNNNALMYGNSRVQFATTGNTGYFIFTKTGLPNPKTQYFKVPDSSSLDMYTGITMEMWVYYNNTSSGPNSNQSQVLFKEINNRNVGVYGFRFENNYYKTQMWAVSYDANANYTGLNDRGNWKQLVVTWDNTDYKYRYYINSTLVFTSTATSPNWTLIPNSTQPLWIGANNFYQPNNFVGDMSIIRLYNRALNSSEISFNFNADRSKFNI